MPKASSAFAAATSFGCPKRLTTRRTRPLSTPRCSTRRRESAC